MKILIGADPEVFVKKDGVVVNAHGLVPGDKKTPHPVKDGAVQVDGMALEFNINPAEDEEMFLSNLDSVLSQLKQMTPGYELLIQPSVEFTLQDIIDAPAESLQLGCEPDFNAYTLEENPRPDAESFMRTAGGHIHIGFANTDNPYGDEHMMLCARVIKALDDTIGMASLLFDGDGERRKMYGCAGAYRPKPYGVEYRTLSNAWLKNSEVAGWVYRTAVKTVERVLQGIYQPKLYSASYYIDNNMTYEARKLFNRGSLVGFKKEWINV